MPTTLYDSPMVYDLLFADRTDDLRFYRSLTPPGAKVLEYGIGSGRVGLKLAQDGANVTGIDPSAPMLSLLAERAALEPGPVRERLRWYQAPAQTFSTEDRFDRVYFPFNGIAHLHSAEDLGQWFGHVRSHLAPRGLFAFDCWIPEPRLLAGTTLQSPRFEDPRTQRPVTLTERFEWNALSQLLRVELTIAPVLAPAETEVLSLCQRMFFPEETRLLLHHHGFEPLWRTTRWAPPPELDHSHRCLREDTTDPDLQGAMLAYVCTLR